VYWTAKFSHCGNNDYEVLKRIFKDLLHKIPKLSRPYWAFKVFPGCRKWTLSSMTFKEEWPPWTGHSAFFGPLPLLAG